MTTEIQVNDFDSFKQGVRVVFCQDVRDEKVPRIAFKIMGPQVVAPED